MEKSKEIQKFLLILLVLSGVLQYFVITIESANINSQRQLFEQSKYFVYMLMWVPALSAFVISKGRFLLDIVTKIDLRYFTLCIFIPLLILIFISLTSVAIGDHVISNILQSNFLILKNQLFLEHIYILLILIGTSAGEELGWRGYLYPKLRSHFSVLRSSLITGLIWGAWHLPIIFFTNYSAEISAIYSMINFMGMALCVSLVMGLIYERSNSIWNFVFLHSIHNYIFYFWLLGSERQSANPLQYSEFGYLTPILYFTISLILKNIQTERFRIRM